MIRKLQGVQHCQASRQAGSFSFYGGTRPKQRLTTTDLPRRRDESLRCWSMLLQSLLFHPVWGLLHLVCKPAEDGESFNSVFILHVSILAGDGVPLEGLKNRGRWLLASFAPWPDSYHRVPSLGSVRRRLCASRGSASPLTDLPGSLQLEVSLRWFSPHPS